MKNIISKSIYVTFGASFLLSCKPDLNAPTPEKGSLDVSYYVAVGNSITAGYADAALYYEGQNYSYAKLLADQFKLIGGGEFKIPYFPQGSIGSDVTGQAPFALTTKNDCKGIFGLGPARLAASGDNTALNTSVVGQGPFNNMGVPGVKCQTIDWTAYGSFNKFFGRMITGTEKFTKSVLDKASSQNHTFFTCFLGNNDVLGYATSGGDGTPFLDDITPLNGVVNFGIYSFFGFNKNYDGVIDKMTAKGQKGAVASVPDVTSIPFFTTIPYNAVTATLPQIPLLNSLFPGINFIEGKNPLLIKDSNGNIRQMKSHELVCLTLPLDSLKCGGWGLLKPIANKYILDSIEIKKIQDAVTGYNLKIKQRADYNNLAYVDVNEFMKKAKTGIVYNGINVNASFVSGGAFSLDGVHLTPRGNALLANEFIKSINAKYGSTIPLIDVTKYRGVKFP